MSTLLINPAAAPAKESSRSASMSRSKFLIAQKQSRQLEEFAKTGIDRIGSSSPL